MKSTKKSLVLSALSLLLCVSMLLGTTYAWFTDSVTSGKNQIISGNLDIEVYHTSRVQTTEEKIDAQTDLFKDVTLWEPGAVAYENFTVKNVGTLAAKYKFNLNIADKNTLTTDSVAHDLTEVIKVAVVEGGFSGDRDDISSLTFTTLASFQKTGELVAKTGSDTYGVVLYWEPTDNDNLYNVNNGKSASDGKDYLFVEFGVNVVATQNTVENDSFDDQYDKNAMYPVLAEPVNISEFYGADVNAQDETTKAISLSGGDVVPAGTLLYTNTEKTSALTDVDITGKLNETIVSTGDPDSTTFDIGYTYVIDGQSEGTAIHGFSEAITHTFTLSTNLKNVKVTHSGTAMTKVDSNPTDGQYSYDPATGVLTIVSSTYSSFKVTYDYDFVAAVNGQGYASLAAAVDAAKDGETVTLLKDATVSSNITVDDNITVDFAGYTVTVSGITGNVFTLAAGKTATVKNGTLKDDTNGACTNVFAVAENTTETASILTLDSIDFGTFNTNNGALLRLFSGKTNAVVTNVTGSTNWRCLNSSEDAASLTATNCTLTCNSGKAAVYSPKTSTINNCTVNNASGYVLGCPTENTMTVNGGTYTGSVVLKVYTSGGHIIVNNATVSGTSYAIYSDSRNAGEDYDNSGDITVNGNSVVTGCVGTQHAAKTYLNGGTYDISGWSASIANSIIVSGGTYTADPTTLNGFVLADGYVAKANGTTPETWTIEEYEVPQPVNNVFTVNSNRELADVINELNTNSAYTTGDYTIQLGAGTIGGTWDSTKQGYIANVYVIKQFPEWNGYYGNGATNNNTVNPNTNCSRITIVGSDNGTTDFKGVIVVVGWGYSNGGDYDITSDKVRTEIKNLNFDYTNVVGVDSSCTAFGNSTDGFMPIIGCAASTNVMITGCSFTKVQRIYLGRAQSSGSKDTDNLYDANGKVAVIKGYSFNPVVKDCTFTNCDTCFDGYFAGSKTASFTNITVTGCDAFINANQGSINTITVKDSNITCSNYLIRTDNQGAKWIFDNCEINITKYDATDKYGVVTFRNGGTEAHTVTFDNCTFTGSKEIRALSGSTTNTVIMKGTSPKASEMTKTCASSADCTISDYTE